MITVFWKQIHEMRSINSYRNWMAPAQNVVNAKFQIVQKPFFKFNVNSNFDLQLAFLQLNC